MGHIVRVEHAEGVVATTSQLVVGKAHDLALALDGNGALQYLGAEIGGRLSGVIGAVIGDHVYIIQFRGIVLGQQAVDQRANDQLLIAGSDQNNKPGPGRVPAVIHGRRQDIRAVTK